MPNVGKTVGFSSASIVFWAGNHLEDKRPTGDNSSAPRKEIVSDNIFQNGTLSGTLKDLQEILEGNHLRND